MARPKAFDPERALEQAMNLFWLKGYHATSMQDLVEALGINRASLYDTFGSKDALFAEAFTQYQRTNRQAIRNFLDSQPDVKSGFRALFLRAVQEASTGPEAKGCLAVNTAAELLPGDEPMAELLRRSKADMEEIFRTYLEEGRRRGDIDAGKDPKALAAFLYTLYNGLQVVAKVDADEEQLTAMIEAGLSAL